MKKDKLNKVEKKLNELREQLKNRGTSGASLPALLTTAFIVLKLTGAVGWSWIWVLAPVWITVVISIILAVLLLLVLYYRIN